MNENINYLTKFVDREVDDAVDRRMLTTYFGCFKEFLNYSYVTHLETEGEEDAVHGVQFSIQSGWAQDRREFKCLKSMSVFEHTRIISLKVRQQTEEISASIKDAGNKFRMYMGHVHSAHV